MQMQFATYQGVQTVTPSDTGFVAGRALYVGGAGNVALITVGGDSVVFAAVPVGAVIPVEFNQILATGTTATLMLALQ